MTNFQVFNLSIIEPKITSVVLVLMSACLWSSSNMDSPVELPNLPCVLSCNCNIE